MDADRPRDGRRSAVASVLVWSVAVLVALVLTLHSLRTDEFDGLNNMLQIPLALPWFMIPRGSNYEFDAWRDAVSGIVNGFIAGGLILWVHRRPVVWTDRH